MFSQDLFEWSFNGYFSIEDDFITWKEKFWPAICEHFGIAVVGEDIRL